PFLSNRFYLCVHPIRILSVNLCTENGDSKDGASGERTGSTSGLKRASDIAGVPAEGIKKPRVLVENPFIYIDPAKDEDWLKIRDYYGIEEESKAHRYLSGRAFCASNLLFRSSGEEALRRRQFYYTNHFVKDLIEYNACRGLKIVNCGVRMFSIMEDKQFNGYRLLQDGVELADAFLPVTGGRRILLTENEHADLVLLLEEEMPLLSRFTEATQNRCDSMSPGPVLIEYRPSSSRSELSENRHVTHCRIVFAGWRGVKSLRHYIGRHERCHLMRMANLEPKPMICGRTPLASDAEFTNGDGPLLVEDEIDEVCVSENEPRDSAPPNEENV
ncbi:putative methyltransferase ncl1, partial [Fasciola hepatica]